MSEVLSVINFGLGLFLSPLTSAGALSPLLYLGHQALEINYLLPNCSLTLCLKQQKEKKPAVLESY